MHAHRELRCLAARDTNEPEDSHSWTSVIVQIGKKCKTHLFSLTSPPTKKFPLEGSGKQSKQAYSLCLNSQMMGNFSHHQVICSNPPQFSLKKCCYGFQLKSFFFPQFSSLYSLSLSGCIVVSECPTFDVVLRHDYNILHMG